MIISPVRHPPLGEQLLVQLRSLIVRGELAPGMHLVEGGIAEQFGVSRGPVRDALRQLELEGLVDTRRRGMFVRGLTEDDLAELYALRGGLEGLAVRECIARLPVGDWSILDAAVDRMRAAAQDNDPSGFAAADLDFHSGFYSIGGNRRLAAVWTTHRALFAAMLDVTNTQDRDLRPIAQYHADLAAVIRRGEVETALTELARHLNGSLERMQAALSERWQRPAS